MLHGGEEGRDSATPNSKLPRRADFFFSHVCNCWCSKILELMPIARKRSTPKASTCTRLAHCLLPFAFAFAFVLAFAFCFAFYLVLPCLVLPRIRFVLPCLVLLGRAPCLALLSLPLLSGLCGLAVSCIFSCLALLGRTPCLALTC